MITNLFAISQQTNLKLLATKYVVTMENIGEIVRRLREEQGWSQSELARRVGGRVKPQNIQQLEDGTVSQPRYLSSLARAFGITVEQLLIGGKLARSEKREGLRDRILQITQEIAAESPDKAKAIQIIAEAQKEKVQAILVLLGEQSVNYPTQHEQTAKEKQKSRRKIKLTLEEAEKTPIPEGPKEDRRQSGDRRQNVQEVDFERRSGVDRRKDSGIILGPGESLEDLSEDEIKKRFENDHGPTK
jgi:transcriptional regulator with XRE-family HTH domain